MNLSWGEWNKKAGEQGHCSLMLLSRSAETMVDKVYIHGAGSEFTFIFKTVCYLSPRLFIC